VPRQHVVRALVLALVVLSAAPVIAESRTAAAEETTPVHLEDRAYTPLVPTRILDTRTGLGVPTAGAVPAGATITVPVAGHAGVPSVGVGAVVFNLTATQPSRTTYITAFPAGTTRPTASNLNVTAGVTAPNLVVAKLGTGGLIALYNHAGSVHLIADVVGWFSDQPDFTALAPARVLDTRTGLGAPKAPVGAGRTIDVQFVGRGGVPPSGAAAVVFNLTGTQPTASTYVAAYPTGEPRPVASNLNLVSGQTAPNLVIAKLGASGRVSLFNKSGATHLLADVLGWFTIGSDYSGVIPARVLDTRTGVGAASRPVGPASTIEVQVTGQAGVPTEEVGAVVLNLTGTAATASTFVTAFPQSGAAVMT
jgi:hypothetical protein